MSLSRDRGFALLIVLWTLALLSLLISQLAASGRQAVRLASSMREQAVLQAVADGAIQEAGFHVAAAGAAHWPANGAVRELRANGASVRLRIVNDAGKINPSIASLELLTALVHGCGIELPKATAIASAITAWRFPSGQSNYGADAYQRAGRTYAPPGQPFDSLGELGLVLGMTPELLACLFPHLSLYRDSDPDPNSADPLVLRVLAETMGVPPALSAAPVDETVVEVSTVAAGPGGARAVRDAVLRMQPRQGAGGPAPANGADGAVQPFRIVDQKP
jgi:general secretion pathway protein K